MKALKATIALAALLFALSIQATAAPELRDGSHDFDFLIGNWKAHVRVLPDRLTGSTTWVEYDGISNHKKLLDSNANFEEFDAYSAQLKKRNKGQTLRLYNPETHQWSIYLVDVDKGTLDLPPVIGQFTGNRGEFYNQDTLQGPGDLRSLCVAQPLAASPLAWNSRGRRMAEKPGK